MVHPVRIIPANDVGDLPATQRLGLTKFVARGLNVVFGPSGSYKSFYVLDSALRVAQSQPVVYVVAEGIGGLYKRMSAWSEHNRKPYGQAYFVDHSINLMSSDEVGSFIKALSEIKPALLIFDTLARCIPGADENSAKDLGIAIRSAERIQQAFKSAIVWVHHTNKAEKGERGSGAIRGASDNMIEVFPNGDGSIRVSCSKDKDDEKWIDQQFSFLPVLNSGVLIPTNGYALLEYSELELRILEFLSLQTFETSGAKVMQMVNALNIPERTIYRLLSQLKLDCQIDQDSKGDPYRLTELGRDTIRHRSATFTDTTEILVEQ